MSLGIHSEVDFGSDDEFNRSIFQSPGILSLELRLNHRGLIIVGESEGQG
jgi:hypothetical protein